MYSIGLDYGTSSCRGVLYNAESGAVEKIAVFDYPHGVIKGMKQQQYLQHPQDYIDACVTIIRQLVEESPVESSHIKAIGIDFTSCSCLPVTKEFHHFASNNVEVIPNAFVKLWKSHSAEKEAQHITEVLQGSEILKYYGGSISSEWLFPKLLELKNDAPYLYEEMAYFMEAGDWLVSLLTNQLSRSSCQAGFKGLYQGEEVSIPTYLLKEIDPSFESLYAHKLSGAIHKVGTSVGTITKEYAELLGLSSETVVGASVIDAHAALPGARIKEGNQMQIVMGTSSCHLVLAKEQVFIPGVAGVVKDGIIPGFYAYEAGQAAVGDLFNHFIEHKLPAEIVAQAEENQQDIFSYLNEKAENIQAHGLIILDWHNGNRTPYMNPNLSGVVVGERLSTTAIDYYKALIESTAFGTRQIIERFEANGIAIEKIIFAGGIPLKNTLLMQVYADVLQRPLQVVKQPELPAVGAARLAIEPFIENEPTQQLTTITYEPLSTKYEKSYEFYLQLSELLVNNHLMHEIHELKF